MMDVADVCLICLEQDTNLYEIKNGSLKESYEALTNCLLRGAGTRGLCWECRARLRAAASLRARARRGRQALAAAAALGSDNMTEKLKSIDRIKNNLVSTLTTTIPIVESCPELHLWIEVKTESPVDVHVEAERDSDGASETDYSSLYRHHEIKQELVLGPEEIQHPGSGRGKQPEKIAPIETRKCYIHNEQNPNEGMVASGNPVLNLDTQTYSYPVDVDAKNNIHTHALSENSEKHKQKHMIVQTFATRKLYPCRTCNRTFETKVSLLDHMKTQHNLESLACTECDYRTTCKRNLVSHQRTHTGRPYKCHICDYKAARSYSLKLHLMSVHAGVKPYKCSHCSYRCSRRSDLLIHERSHTGEKPYKCSHCSYKCSAKNSLLQHERKHTGVKPYKCSHCSYTCSQKGDLLKHERRHTGEKPYKCIICEYKSTNSSGLMNHMRNHARRRKKAIGATL